MVKQNLKVVVASKKASLPDCITFAEENSLGIEVKDFSLKKAFDTTWMQNALETKKLLKSFNGPLSLHSIIYDYPVKWTNENFKQILTNLSSSLEVAKIIEASTVIVHSSYFPDVSINFYDEWLSFQVDLWGKLSEVAKNFQITIALENIIDNDPSSIIDVVQTVNYDNFKVCIDFGHLNLVNSRYSSIEWINYLKNYLHYAHLHNNNGINDSHKSLDNGNIDYNKVLDTLFSLQNTPILALEVDYLDGVAKSLQFLQKVYSCKV